MLLPCFSLLSLLEPTTLFPVNRYPSCKLLIFSYQDTLRFFNPKCVGFWCFLFAILTCSAKSRFLFPSQIHFILVHAIRVFLIFLAICLGRFRFISCVIPFIDFVHSGFVSSLIVKDFEIPPHDIHC